VLCRKVAAKRVEDGADNQSVCSQVLVRQISQLPNGASGDSTDRVSTPYWRPTDLIGRSPIGSGDPISSRQRLVHEAMKPYCEAIAEKEQCSKSA
jgi:hypothetical protein